MTIDVNQSTKTKKLPLDGIRLFHAVNGGIVTSFWVALANLLQLAWLPPQPGWTIPSATLGFVFGTVGSWFLYKPKPNQNSFSRIWHF